MSVRSALAVMILIAALQLTAAAKTGGDMRTSGSRDPGGASAPSVSAVRVDEAIRVDGRLDETVWQTAQPIGRLTQREPSEGDSPSEETDVWVLYDDDALYFGIRCRDHTPDGIVATQLTRDASLEVDDRIIIAIDPFFDQRNGFFFEVNPVGARADGQITNSDSHISYDWDGIWDASARVTEEGWVAELAIPFKTLRFKPGQTVWGFNFERHIKRRQEIDRWASARRDVWLSNLVEAGHLEGLHGIRQGHGFEVRPYAAGGMLNSEGKFDVGIDLSKNVAPNLNASVTVNTDFAETEVDARQINLTRFPLFFPEKRAFFLEGAGVFDVAGLNTSRDVVPFFSRRIGLLEGEEVPVLVGAKLIGRQGNYNIGIVDVRTRDIKPNPLTGQNLLAARVTRNIFRQSWIGAMVTNGNPTGLGGNTLVGADVRLATSSFRGTKNLSLDLWMFRTNDKSTASTDHAAGFKVDYPNDLWDMAILFKHIGDGFRPALGFVPRRGIRRTNAGITFKPRPHRWGIRQFTFAVRPDYITNLGNRVENWLVRNTVFGVRTESGENLSWEVTPEFEHLDEPFEITDGVLVPAGSYRWTQSLVSVQTANKRPWVIAVKLGWGSFYDGDRQSAEIGLTLKPNPHLAFAIQSAFNDVELPAGHFTTRLMSLRADYNFSPDVSWANLVQYDSDSRLLGLQSRFRWILKPGNDLFLVFNRGWERVEEGRYLPVFDRGSGKLQYTFRF